MGKILVTGGAGYIGAHVVLQLHKLGFSTLVLDNLSNGHRELVKNAEFVQGDLNDVALLKRIFASETIDAVMHFAAFAYVGESVEHPARYYKNNVSNTLNLVTQMVESGVRKMIFSSTCATYGVARENVITEDHPQLPINPYGKSKLMIEEILDDFGRAYGLQSVIFRYFNAAGADPEGQIGEWHEPETHLLPLVLDVAIGKSETLNIFGNDYPTPDGTCIRDYIHVSDIAQAHILGLQYLQSGKKSEVFNLGNGLGFSVRSVVETVEKVCARRIRISEKPRREGDPAVLVGSSEKAKRVLGWRPAFPKMEQIVETAWKWHQALHRSRSARAAALALDQPFGAATPELSQLGTRSA
jgi:UDP-glucose 4-epimerase